jgi:hypothetical protein
MTGAKKMAGHPDHVPSASSEPHVSHNRRTIAVKARGVGALARL